MDLESVAQSEVRKKKKKTVVYEHRYVESRKMVQMVLVSGRE